MTTVHVAIGNSDNRLTQKEWSRFYFETDRILSFYAKQFYGRWVSPSTAEFQNACWAFEPREPSELGVSRQRALARLAKKWGQVSIAVNESETEFVAALE